MENNTIGTIHNLIAYQITKFLSSEAALKNSLQKWVSDASSPQIMQLYPGNGNIGTSYCGISARIFITLQRTTQSAFNCMATLKP